METTGGITDSDVADEYTTEGVQTTEVQSEFRVFASVLFPQEADYFYVEPACLYLVYIV